MNTQSKMGQRLFEGLRVVTGRDPGAGGRRTEASACSSSVEKIVCDAPDCTGVCGRYHHCANHGHWGGTRDLKSEARLLPVAAFMKGGRLRASCEDCCVRLNTSSRLHGRGARSATDKAAAAQAHPRMLGFQHTDAELARVANGLLPTIRGCVGPADAVYFWEYNGVPKGASDDAIDRQIRTEGLAFLSANRGRGMRIVATKRDGCGLSDQEIKQLYDDGSVVSLVLYFNEFPDGAGKDRIEGLLAELLGAANGGLGPQSGGRVLNLDSSAGGGRVPALGHIQAIGVTVVRGGLEALGLELRDEGGAGEQVVRGARSLVVPEPRATDASSVRIRDSGAAWRQEGETYSAFLDRWRGRTAWWEALSDLERLEYEKGVRHATSPTGGAGWLLGAYYLQEAEPPQGWSDGIEALAASGAVEKLGAGITLYRALSAQEAEQWRAAQARGELPPLLFARESATPLSADEWGRQLKLQVEKGSYMTTMAVSCSEGSGYVCAALAESAVKGGRRGGIVVSINTGHLEYAICVSVGGSKLLESDSQAAADAERLREVQLLSDGGLGVYKVVYIDGAVVPGCSLGPPSDAPLVSWYDPPAPPPFSDAVVLFTNVQKKDALVAGIRERGGSVVHKFSGRVTVVVADDKRTDSSKLRQATKRVPALPVLTVDELRAAFAKVPVRAGASAAPRRASDDSAAESAPDDSEDDSPDA